MNEKRAKKKREKFRVEASWTVMLVLFRLVKEVTEKKRVNTFAGFIFNVFQRQWLL